MFKNHELDSAMGPGTMRRAMQRVRRLGVWVHVVGIQLKMQLAVELKNKTKPSPHELSFSMVLHLISSLLFTKKEIQSAARRL